MMNFVLAFLGFLLFIVIGMIKTKKKHLDKEFNPLIYLKDELLTLIAAGLSMTILLLLLPDISEIMSPTYAKFEGVVSCAIGYFNYAIFSSIMNIVVSKKFRS